MENEFVSNIRMFSHLLIYRCVFLHSQILIMCVDSRSNKVMKTFLAWTAKDCILTLALCFKRVRSIEKK